MRRILLIIGGGIAAYKVLELIRRGREQGLVFRVILTRAGSQFVTPLSVASLAEEKIYTDLFSLTDEAEMGHIRLSREADLVVVAPATADLLAKMANGHADDLASTTLLATDKPVLAAPAMNPMMWAHAATRRNVATLEADGVRFVGPESGDMACGETGAGRMAEPMVILDAIMAALQNGGVAHTTSLPRLLDGKRAIVTSGPTHEAIDPVRYIANRSSGRQGHAIAAALAAAGSEVTLVTGPVAIPDPPGVTVRHVESARDMLAAVEEHLPADVAVCAAAVADWRPAALAEAKLKKDKGVPEALTLALNPDILQTLSRHTTLRPRLVIGFAAETENLLENARTKRTRKGCDWILANAVGAGTGVFGGERNTVHLVRADSASEAWPEMSKAEVAQRLVARIAETLGR